MRLRKFLAVLSIPMMAVLLAPQAAAASDPVADTTQADAGVMSSTALAPTLNGGAITAQALWSGGATGTSPGTVRLQRQLFSGFWINEGSNSGVIDPSVTVSCSASNNVYTYRTILFQGSYVVDTSGHTLTTCLT